MIEAQDIKIITNDSVNTVINLSNQSAIIITDQNKSIYDSLFSVDQIEFNDIINKHTPKKNEDQKHN